jgi:hypothetical protein
MVATGLGVELSSGARHRARRPQREGRDGERHLNFATFLNIVFLALAAVLVWRYFRRGGGIPMLRMMNAPSGHDHAGHQHHAA